MTFINKIFLFSFIVILNLIFNVGKTQNIYTFAGTGTLGFNGDGGSAVNAQLYSPNGLAFDGASNIFISDPNGNRIRKVNISGIISTFAGTGIGGYGGDGGLAVNAQLSTPSDVAVDPLGNVYIADFNNHLIRKVNTLGIITTFAGTGFQGFSGDGGIATNAKLNGPTGIACDQFGNVFICDNFNFRVRKVNTSGIISTIAGTGVQGYNGDGIMAVNADLNWPIQATVDASDNIYITEQNGNRIRMVNPLGFISTIVGTGIPGSGGDGGSAINAQLNLPYEVAFDSFGNLYISDRMNSKIRKVNTSGIISTYAGTGTYGYSGDSGPATSAELKTPQGITVDASNNIYIADRSDTRVREICPAGCITNIISNFENENDILFYPNPIKDKLIIENEGTKEITITNCLGQIFYVSTNPVSRQEIDLSILLSGIYYLKIQSNSRQKVHKIIKK